MFKKIMQRVLKKMGKTYRMDPTIPDGFIIDMVLIKAISLLRGFIFLRSKVFLGKRVVLAGKKYCHIGKFSALDDHVYLNAYAKEGLSLGRHTKIGSHSRILCTTHLSLQGQGFSLGDYSACGEFCYFGATGGIRIGRNVIMGQYVSMHAQEHIYSDITKLIREQGTAEKGIIIDDNCWIGAKVTVLDGTKIGKHCVIAAGAVVKGTFPDYCVIGGVPARVIKQLNEQ